MLYVARKGIRNDDTGIYIMTLWTFTISISCGKSGNCIGLGDTGNGTSHVSLWWGDPNWLTADLLLIALVVAVVLGSSFTIVMALLALLAWSAFVRNVRANVLVLREADYVDLAKVAGASTNRILVRHMLPGIIGTVTVIASLSVGQLIMAEATLSFLGAGIPAPTPSWGSMISEGRDYLQRAWWTSASLTSLSS